MKSSWISRCKCLEPFDVVRILRQERIEHRLVLARSIKPALDADLGDQLVETERAADHADRADDRTRIGNDLVGGAGEHVAAGGGGVLDEGDDLAAVFLRQIADAAEDQVRLRRRAARRIDDQRDRGGVAHARTARSSERAMPAMVRPGRSGVEKFRSRQQAAAPAPPGDRGGNAAEQVPAAPMRRASTPALTRCPSTGSLIDPT